MNETRIFVSTRTCQTRIAVTQSDRLIQLEPYSTGSPPLLDAICAAQVVKVLPGIQSAFVDIGTPHEAFMRREGLSPKPKVRSRRGPAPIEDQIKQGQSLLVQVIKEPHEHKSAVVRQSVKLIGFSSIFIPGPSFLKFSKKIASDTRALAERLAPLQELPGGWIVRHFAQSLPMEKVVAEAENLFHRSQSLTDAWKASGKPRVFDGPERDPVLRALKRWASPALAGITVDSPEEAQRLRSLLEAAAPPLAAKVRCYTGQLPLFETLGLENQIQVALASRVYLKSGGYLEFREGAGMAVIDVNSGKMRSHHTKPETALATNREAVAEIGIQVQVRDLSGLVAIDFIDMHRKSDRQTIDRDLNRILEGDRPTDVLPMNRFCVAMFTRQRLSASLQDRLYTACPCCSGRGMVKKWETQTYEIMTRLTRDAPGMEGAHITISCHPDLASHLQARAVRLFDALARDYQLKVDVIPSPSHGPADIDIG